MTLDKYKLDKIIYEWVKRNYGRNEASKPSWSIIELVNEIVDKYDKPLDEKTNSFELTMLVKQDMTLKELGVLHDVVMKHFEDSDTWKRWENDGVKELAYSIKGETHAGYLWVEGNIKDSERVKLVEFLDNDPHMLRYLLIEQDPKKLKTKGDK